MANYREKLIELHDKQVTKGAGKYGTSLEGSAASLRERIKHLREELLDGTLYTFWIDDLAKQNPTCQNCGCYDTDDCKTCVKIPTNWRPVK